MVIYAEYLFLENCAVGFLILLLVKRLFLIETSKYRIIAGGILSGLAAFSIFIEGGIFISYILRFLIGAVIIITTFGTKNFIKNACLFYILTFILGGLSFCILCLGKSFSVSNNGFLYSENLTYPFVFFALSIGTAIICTLGKAIWKNKFDYSMKREILICLGDVSIKAKSLIDSGNTLREPLTGASVIVVSGRLMYRLTDIITEEEIAKRFCLIPFTTVGTEKGIMKGIRAEYIEYEGIRRHNIVLAIYNGLFRDDYDVLLNRDMIRGCM